MPKGVGGVISVVLLLAIFIIGGVYSVQILGSTDQGVNLTGTDYEDQYNSTTDTTITSLTIMNFIPWILVVVGLFISLFMLRGFVK